MHFAEWLQSKITSLNLTNYRVSKMAGVHQTTIAKWLSGESEPQPGKEKLVREAIAAYESELKKRKPPVRPSDFSAQLRKLPNNELLKIQAEIAAILIERAEA